MLCMHITFTGLKLRMSMRGLFLWPLKSITHTGIKDDYARFLFIKLKQALSLCRKDVASSVHSFTLLVRQGSIPAFNTNKNL